MTPRAPLLLRRQGASRLTKRAYLVVHSRGAEEEYLHWLKRVMLHSQITLLPVDDGMPAREVVALAAKQKKAARLKGSSYDEVWCVLRPAADLKGAEDDARRSGVQVVVNAPSFDLWLLLHFADPPNPPSGSAVSGALSQHMPDLTESPRESMESLAGKYIEAQGRHASLSPELRTDMPNLVESIRRSLCGFLAVDTLDGP